MTATVRARLSTRFPTVVEIRRHDLLDWEVARLLLARARHGEFGRDGTGRPPGITPLSKGSFRIGERVYCLDAARRLAQGEPMEGSAGWQFPVVSEAPMKPVAAAAGRRFRKRHRG